MQQRLITLAPLSRWKYLTLVNGLNVIGCVFLSVFAVSCGGGKREVKVEETRVEVERHDDLRFQIGGSGGEFLKDVKREYIRVMNVENDWRLIGNPVSGPFPPLVTFAAGEQSRATLNVRLQGDLLGNVNRWRHDQFGLEKASSLSDLEKVELFEAQGYLVEIEGTFQGRNKDWAMLSAIVFHRDLFVCVLKLTGPKDEVSAQKESFLKMLGHFKYEY